MVSTPKLRVVEEVMANVIIRGNATQGFLQLLRMAVIRSQEISKKMEDAQRPLESASGLTHDDYRVLFGNLLTALDTRIDVMGHPDKDVSPDILLMLIDHGHTKALYTSLGWFADQAELWRNRAEFIHNYIGKTVLYHNEEKQTKIGSSEETGDRTD